MKEIIYRYGRDFCKDRLLIAYAQERKDWKELPAILEKIEKINVPDFPIRGQDIIALATIPDKFVGVIMKSLENYWISEGFKYSKEELLSLADKMFSVLANSRHHE